VHGQLEHRRRVEHARLTALGIEADPPFEMPNTPLMFMVSDPDGNIVTVVEAAPAG